MKTQFFLRRFNFLFPVPLKEHLFLICDSFVSAENDHKIEKTP